MKAVVADGKMWLRDPSLPIEEGFPGTAMPKAA
jgi:hypothetical protein